MSNQAKRLSDCPAERLAQCRGGLAPPVGGELEVLAWRVLGYNFNTEAFALDYARWAEDIEQVRYLVDRAHATRLQAEVSALQQRLNIADQRVCDPQCELARIRPFWKFVSQAFNTLDCSDKYQIVSTFQSREAAWGAYEALVKAPAPPGQQ